MCSIFFKNVFSVVMALQCSIPMARMELLDSLAIKVCIEYRQSIMAVYAHRANCSFF
jgi:hypothetical protein